MTPPPTPSPSATAYPSYTLPPPTPTPTPSPTPTPKPTPTPTPAPVPPSVPRSLAASPNLAAGVGLTWQAPLIAGSSPVTGYRVYRGTGGGAVTPLVTIGNLLGYTDASVANGTTYRYAVSAISASGEGPKTDRGHRGPRHRAHGGAEPDRGGDQVGHRPHLGGARVGRRIGRHGFKVYRARRPAPRRCT